MAIYLPIPIEPFPGSSDEKWQAWFDVHSKAIDCYTARTNQMTLFGLFSRKLSREFDEAYLAYQISVKKYNRL